MRIFLYVITVGLVSAGGLTIEIVAGRMLAPYIGMSLYTWTAIIAVVLAGLSIGHWIGGRLADKPLKDSELLIGSVLLLSSISAVASLILLRLLSGPIMNLGMSPVPTISLLTFSLFFLPSFFIGIPSPMLTKLAIERRSQNMGQIVGLMYASGSVGGILGTLAAGYIFISWLGTINTIILVAIMYLALSFVFLTFSVKRKYSAILGFIFTAFISMGIIYSIGKSTQAFESHCTNESDYYCIRIVDISRELGQEARLMVLDHLGHGMNLKDSPGIFQSPYIELTDLLVKKHFTDHSSIRSYFIGGGALTLPRAWSKQYPEMDISVAEIDPTVTTLAMSEMWVEKADNLKIMDLDGRIALRTSNEAEYDVIVGDAFHDIAVPQHLITKEFFDLVRSRLSNDGLYLMTVVDHVENPRFMLSVYKTLKKSFTHVQIWLDEEQEARATFLLSASESPINHTFLKSDVFPNRAWIKWSEHLVEQMVTTHRPLTLTDNFAPVDRLITAD